MVKITFLGTMGWYSTELGYTPCVLLETDNEYIVLDAGEGIKDLNKYVKEDKPIYIFISHMHLDHSNGIHFFNKFKDFKQKVYVCVQDEMVKYLKILWNYPFTATPEYNPFDSEIVGLNGNTKLPFNVKYLLLEHAAPCLGFRFVLDGKVITYCTDTGVCDNSKELSKDADVLIHECAHLPEEVNPKWPHTNPEEVGNFAKECNVKQLILIHFDARRFDTIDKINNAEKIAKSIFENTIVSRDGMVVNLE